MDAWQWVVAIFAAMFFWLCWRDRAKQRAATAHRDWIASAPGTHYVEIQPLIPSGKDAALPTPRIIIDPYHFPHDGHIVFCGNLECGTIIEPPFQGITDPMGTPAAILCQDCQQMFLEDGCRYETAR